MTQSFISLVAFRTVPFSKEACKFLGCEIVYDINKLRVPSSFHIYTCIWLCWPDNLLTKMVPRGYPAEQPKLTWRMTLSSKDGPFRKVGKPSEPSEDNSLSNSCPQVSYEQSSSRALEIFIWLISRRPHFMRSFFL